MSSPFWQCVEEFSGRFAAAAIWRERLGRNFGPLRAALLDLETDPLAACDRTGSPGLQMHDGTFEGFLQVNWTRLCKTISAAFGLNHKTIDLPLPATCQIGSWSTDAIPIILTVQAESRMFRHVICELAVRLRKPFILLGPTSSHIDVTCHELLANAGAEFFGLDSNTSITESGSLRLLKSPPELFARFTPAPTQPLDEDTTRKAFALVKALDNRKCLKKPSAVTVFSFYCIDGLNVSDIARRCHCSRGTILNRLNFIRKKTGTNPDNFRQLSRSMANSEDSLSNFRARQIHRKRLASYAEEGEEQ